MCTIERGGGLDCLFGEVVLIRMSNLHSILMHREHLKKTAQLYVTVAFMQNVMSCCFYTETCMEISTSLKGSRLCEKHAFQFKH